MNFKLRIPYLVLIGCLVLLLFNFYNLSLLFQNTSVVGSDMGSHYYFGKYFHEQIFSSGQLRGWDHHGLIGFPALQYYHPFPFIVISCLALFIPYAIAFKIVVFLSGIILPFAIYLTLRLIRSSRLIASTAAVFSLTSLYHIDHEILGGNLASVYSGEFCLMLASAFLLILSATLYRGITNGQFIITSGLLLAALGMTHLVTFVVACTLPFYYLFSRHWKHNLIYLAKVYCLGFCLVAWWALPLFIYRHFSGELFITGNSWYPQNTLWVYFPRLLLPFHALIILFCSYRIITRQLIPRKITLFIFPMLTSSIFLYHNLIGWAGRFHPIIGLYAILVAALILEKLLKNKKSILLNLGYSIIMLIMMISYYGGWNKAHNYYKYSFQGIEKLKSYEDLKKLNNYLINNVHNSRFAGDYGKTVSSQLTHRIYDYVAYINGIPAANGIYNSSSISYAPAREILETLKKGNLPINFDQQLEMFNIGYLAVIEPKIQEALSKSEKFAKVFSSGPIQLYKLKQASHSYVKVLEKNPKVLSLNLKAWKQNSFENFKTNPHFSKVYSNNALPPNKQNEEINVKDCVTEQEFQNTDFIFSTRCLGQPHVIKISYYPSWQIEGADQIYLINPSLMLVYPNSEKVRIYYGKTNLNIIANLLFPVGLLLILILIIKKKTIASHSFQQPIRTGTILTVVAIGYVYLLIPNLYFGVNNYLKSQFVSLEISQLIKKKDYEEALTLIKNSKNRFTTEKIKLEEGRIYYHQNRLNQLSGITFFLAGNYQSSEATAEVRYYYSTLLKENKRYAEYLHEVYIIKKSHPNSSWANKAWSDFEAWKRNYPMIYEEYQQFFK